jgi:hypothetical protein
MRCKETAMAPALYELLSRSIFRHANVNQMVDRRHAVLHVENPTSTQQFPDESLSKSEGAGIIDQRNGVCEYKRFNGS